MSIIGRAVVLGATGQTGSGMLEELLGGSEPQVKGVVAYGNSRLPKYDGPRKELLECRQVVSLSAALPPRMFVALT